MPRPSLDIIALQNNLKKDNKEHIEIENKNLNEVFAPHHCYSTLFVRHLISLHQPTVFSFPKYQQYHVCVNYFSTIE